MRIEPSLNRHAVVRMAVCCNDWVRPVFFIKNIENLRKWKSKMFSKNQNVFKNQIKFPKTTSKREIFRACASAAS